MIGYSRATAPGRCVECDDPAGTKDPRRCDECADVRPLERVALRYQNGEGVTPMGVIMGVELVRAFHPLHWRLGVEVDVAPFALAIGLGPWVFYVRRYQL